MLEKLPAELQLKILSFLELSDLHAAQLISHSWNDLFIAHQNLVYRNASYMHGLIQSPDLSLEKAIAAAPRGSTDGVVDWKMFIQRKLRMENNWQGREQPNLVTMSSSGHTVHRIKVDESRGLIITTHQYGGLVVNDLDKNQILWTLPPSYVGDYAHCEYDAGFLVFTCHTGNLEVWRLADDFDASDGPLESLPEEEQIRMSDLTAEYYRSNTLRGHFRAWALIQPPTTTRSSRCVYPNILAAGQNQAFLWDLLTGKLVVTVDNIARKIDGEPLGHINYVELNKDYVIICGENQLRIYANRTPSTLLYHITSSLRGHAPLSVQLGKLSDQYVGKTYNMAPIPLTWSMTGITEKNAQAIYSSDRYKRALLGNDGFAAAHFSPCGMNLVCMYRSGRILLIKNADSVIRRETTLAGSALQVNLQPNIKPSGFDQTTNAKYLAVGVGRIAVATEIGIFVISLNEGDGNFIFQPQPADPLSLLSPFPRIAICHAPCFRSRRSLSELSCLQITATALYLTWDANLQPPPPIVQADPFQTNHEVVMVTTEAHMIPNEESTEQLDNTDFDEFIEGPVGGNYYDYAAFPVDQGIVNPHENPDLHSTLIGDVANDEPLSDLQSVSDTSDDEGWVFGFGHVTVVSLDFLPK